MSLPTQHASIRAWQDEHHVIENRHLYRDKFSAFVTLLSDVCEISKPPASFYVWLKVPANCQLDVLPGETNDCAFARQLFAHENLTVLPGSYLSRESAGVNPGAGHVRIALVAPLDECIKAAHRIKDFLFLLSR
jgi:N-succinyldiaminopimelate aminotransferase